MTDERRAAYFRAFVGVAFPFEPKEEIPEAEARQRLAYFRGHYDASGRLCKLEKFVNGEVEFTHDYEYHANAKLRRAVVTGRGHPERVYEFDSDGHPVKLQKSPE